MNLIEKIKSIISAITVALFFSSLVSGCAIFQSHTTQNATGQEVVKAFETSLSVLDSACIVYANETNNAQMLADCSSAYASTKTKIIDLETALNNNSETFVCTVAIAESSLEDFAHVYTSKGNPLPVAVLAAESIGQVVGASCSSPSASMKNYYEDSQKKLGLQMP